MNTPDWELFYGKCWDILVEHAGAHEDDRGYNRRGFIQAMLDEGYGGCQEYRFGGYLGFGGKFRRNSNRDCRVHVTCYPEDETKKTTAVIARVNKLLRDLQEKLVEGPVYGPPQRHQAALQARSGLKSKGAES